VLRVLRQIPRLILLIGPTLSFAFGFFLNSIVMAANKGQMPVLWPGGRCTDAEQMGVDIWHSCFVPTIHLKFLADWIPYDKGMMSPGDLFILLWDATLWPCLIIWATLMIYEYNQKEDLRTLLR